MIQRQQTLWLLLATIAANLKLHVSFYRGKEMVKKQARKKKPK